MKHVSNNSFLTATVMTTMFVLGSFTQNIGFSVDARQSDLLSSVSRFNYENTSRNEIISETVTACRTEIQIMTTVTGAEL